MQTQQTNPTAYRSIFSNEFCEIMESQVTGFKSLHALKAFEPGDLISPFNASFVSTKPSYLTVQVGYRKHITLLPQFLQYINHSCNPNAFFNTTTMELTALRTIQPGDEYSFFYPSTEWDMAQPFQCNCNQPDCLGLISGAAFIPEEILKRYTLTDFILNRLKSRQKKLRA
ncbi:MAG: SET domain-containing protein-lysine N-methyltransferase [Terrimonas sp.]|nr:SET domain-containing protein-lysine N-methyltransferase [Terrimonas sp.]